MPLPKEYKEKGWGDYANTILDKINDLHKDHKETTKAISELTLAVEKLKINQEQVTALKQWKKEVTETWSSTQMKEAKDEIYVQKAKWSIVYGVIIAVNVIWAVIFAFLKVT